MSNLHVLRCLCILIAIDPLGPILADDKPKKPNLIWITADDLGYGDLGCYGQRTIETPNLDRMASKGLRFTHFYSGATVCAPSSSVLMTGMHHGHTRERGNSGLANPTPQALQDNDLTVAKVLQQGGCRTALIGKWGLGDVGPAETGLPRKQGFNYFFGYLNQPHAHNHFPSFLLKNEERIAIPNVITPVGDTNAGYAENPKVFADDLFVGEAIKFVKENQSDPFYLYKIQPKIESDHVAYFGDWMSTATDLAGVAPPNNTDSLSFAPTLLGTKAKQKEHEFLYREFHEGGFKQAAL